MVNLVEAGFADQNDVTRVFGYSVRTLRRCEERYDQGGIAALGRAGGRPQEASSQRKVDRRRDRLVHGMKNEGLSNCEVGRRLGISEAAVRKRVKRSGWVSSLQQRSLFASETVAAGRPTPAASSQPLVEQGAELPARTPSLASDPCDRSIDRHLCSPGPARRCRAGFRSLRQRGTCWCADCDSRHRSERRC